MGEGIGELRTVLLPLSHLLVPALYESFAYLLSSLLIFFLTYLLP